GRSQFLRSADVVPARARLARTAVRPAARTTNERRGEAMTEVMVGELSEFAEGGYRVLRVNAFEFGIFREGDRLVAYENHCPHDGGPGCQGRGIPRVGGERAPDQNRRGLRLSKRKKIVWPWHGWEFDTESGRHCGDPRYRLRSVDVKVRDNRVYVSIPGEA